MLDKSKVDKELARRLCAAFVSHQMGVSIATQYKKTPPLESFPECLRYPGGRGSFGTHHGGVVGELSSELVARRTEDLFLRRAARLPPLAMRSGCM